MSEAQQTVTAPARKPASTGGVKDTIESILVAFILAFVFRAFVVEAFVIPTGSMATTLLGAHTRFHCPDCAYDFDLNYQQPKPPGTDPEAETPVDAFAAPLSNPIYCPNCGFQMPGTDYPLPSGTPANDAFNAKLLRPPVFYGDRILVLKYLYLLQQPQRFDVVVFKAPMQMTMNYIKRLIGKPGEGVMVLDGDVYIRPAGATDPANFIVQPKPKAIQDALWRLVYDNDYHPEQKLDRGSVHRWTQPWTVVEGNGWNLDDSATNGRSFQFSGDNTSSRLRFDPQANPTAQTQSEYTVYDQQPMQGIASVRSTESRYPMVPTEHGQTGEMPVSDLDLRLTYSRIAGAGPTNLFLQKRGHLFIAQISANQATLYHDFNGKRTIIGTPMQLSASSKPMRIEFSNADYQVTFRINDAIVAQSTPADFAPNLPVLIREFVDSRTPPPGRVELQAENQQCTISHLSLWRDNYYYNDRDIVRRATPKNFPENTVSLGPDEYFVMGDNSILSYDARCWENGIHLPAEKLDVEAGRVPGRFLLGKAFYVYWPAGYLVYPGLPALVPNFAAMRLIH